MTIWGLLWKYYCYSQTQKSPVRFSLPHPPRTKPMPTLRGSSVFNRVCALSTSWVPFSIIGHELTLPSGPETLVSSWHLFCFQARTHSHPSLGLSPVPREPFQSLPVCSRAFKTMFFALERTFFCLSAGLQSPGAQGPSLRSSLPSLSSLHKSGQHWWEEENSIL